MEIKIITHYENILFSSVVFNSLEIWKKLKLEVPLGIFSCDFNTIYVAGNSTKIGDWVGLINHEFFHQIFYGLFSENKPFIREQEEFVTRLMSTSKFKIAEKTQNFCKKLQEKINGNQNEL